MTSRRPGLTAAARRSPLASVMALGLCLSLLAATPTAATAAQTPEVPADPIPVLAYYYIWYNATSWNRAKTDYPRAGRYSSDEATVMREHVRQAQAAGIDGFIVSWKSTPVLDTRLRLLADVAEEEGFKLGLIYQGLDFDDAEPLPAARVAADLDLFARDFAPRPAFSLFDKPMVVWSGTWRFSPGDVATVAGPLRDRLLVLASDRSADEYARLDGSVDGNAYYWASADPDTKGYERRLQALGAAVRKGRGLWIAPAAPGYDARKVGGTKVVERRDGATLRSTLDTALATSPDAVGLISWNEFSENSHVEPSTRYGGRYLEVLADVLQAPAGTAADFDSSEPGGPGGRSQRAMVLGGMLVLMVGSVMVIARRRSLVRELPAGPSEA